MSKSQPHHLKGKKRWTNKKIFYSLLFLPWEEFLLDSEYNKEGKLKLIRDFLCDFLLRWRVMSTHYKFLVSMPASSLLSICYRIPGSFLFLCQMVTLMEFASMKEKGIDSIVQWYSLGNVSNSKRISSLLNEVILLNCCCLFWSWWPIFQYSWSHSWALL